MQDSPVLLVILLVTVFVSYRAFNDRALLEKYLFYPHRMQADGSWYRFLSSGFIHADLTHLAFNMFTLYSFAQLLEPVMGSLKFLLFYLISLVTSGLTSYNRHKDNPLYRALGASGAVSAVVLATIMYAPSGIRIYGFIPGWIFAILYMGYSHYASRNSNDNIGHEAHLWGGISGVVLGLTMSHEIRDNFLYWLQYQAQALGL